MGFQGIRDAYETGRGRIRMRAVAHIEPQKGGHEAIVITELPYQVQARAATTASSARSPSS